MSDADDGSNFGADEIVVETVPGERQQHGISSLSEPLVTELTMEPLPAGR
jgi:hypothetical protein